LITADSSTVKGTYDVKPIDRTQITQNKKGSLISQSSHLSSENTCTLVGDKL